MYKPLSVSIIGAVLLALGGNARAEFIHAAHHKPYPEIRVEANDAGQYVKVVNPHHDLKFVVGGRGRGNYRWHLGDGRIAIESVHSGAVLSEVDIDVNPDNRSFGADKGQSWVDYNLYTSGTPALPGYSAVELCNLELDGRTNTDAGRAALVKSGFTIMRQQDFKVVFELTWTKERIFPLPGQTPYHTYRRKAEQPARLMVHCLGESAARSKTGTTGGPRPTGRHISEFPLITGLDLRAEPGEMQSIDGWTCPAKLFLYGRIETGARSFEGKAVFFGSGFLAAPIPIDLPTQGTRNVKAVYPLAWGGTSGGVAAGQGGFTAGGDTSSGPKSQTASITLNVADADNAVVESTGARTFDVVCAKPEVNSAVPFALPGGPAIQSPDADGPDPAGQPPADTSPRQSTPLLPTALPDNRRIEPTDAADPDPARRRSPAPAPDERLRAPSPDPQPGKSRFERTRPHVSPGTGSRDASRGRSEGRSRRPAFGAGQVRYVGEANDGAAARAADPGAGSAHDRYANAETSHLPGRK